MKLHPSLLRLLFGALAGACSTVALAQWQWLDRDGRKVFSDRPPPADIADSKILKRPAGSGPRAASNPAPAVPVADGTAAPAPAATAPAPPKPTGEDKELLEKKKQADDAEAAKKKAEDDRLAKARKDNCGRARQAKATLDSGIRIAQTNAQGERVILDDAARAAEQKRAQDTISADCK